MRSLARAYIAHGSDSEIDDEATKIDSELQGAKLVSVDGTPLRRGTFVVVLAPGTHGSDSYQTAQMVISHDLVKALVDGSDGTVVASTPTSSSTGGLIDVLSADKSLDVRAAVHGQRDQLRIRPDGDGLRPGSGGRQRGPATTASRATRWSSRPGLEQPGG